MNQIIACLDPLTGLPQLADPDPRPPQPILVLDGTPTLDPDQTMTCRVHSTDSSRQVEFESSVVRGNVIARQVTPSIIRADCELICQQSFCPKEIVWNVRAGIQQPRVLNNQFRLVPVSKSDFLGALTPVALQGRNVDRWVAIVGANPLAGHAWQPCDEAMISAHFWLDHQLSHPRFSFEGPQFRNWNNSYRLHPGHRLSFQFYLIVSNHPIPVVVPGRYPRRNRAVFSITDHADHDTNQRVAALWYGHSRREERAAAEPAGFVGLDLPFTKSVFPATTEADGPGLHNASFANVCRAGYQAGIEICPHGVHSSVQPQVNELESLLSQFDEFQPRTWIDHGNRFLSNYGRRGWDPDDEYSLHPWLDRLGIQYVWGRMDFGHALPRGQLDQLQIDRFCGSSYMRDLPSNFRRACVARRPWAILHGLSVLAYQLLPESTMLQFFLAQRRIQRVMKADLQAIPSAVWQSGKMAAALVLPPGVTQFMRHFGGVREEISRIPIFYPEHHATSQGTADRWLFNTVAVHDVERAYASEAFDRLVADYGIHFSHTYLTSVSRAHLSHAIQPGGDGHWCLTPKFDQNLRDLARRRDAGQVWVATMAEIGDFWSARYQLRLKPTSELSWEFELPQNGDRRAIDLQFAVLGPTADCHAAERRIELDTLHDQVRLGTVSLQPGHSIGVSCQL